MEMKIWYDKLSPVFNSNNLLNPTARINREKYISNSNSTNYFIIINFTFIFSNIPCTHLNIQKNEHSYTFNGKK